MPKRRKGLLRAGLVRKLKGVARRLRGPFAAVVVLFLVACVTEEVGGHRGPTIPPPELVGEPTIRVQIIDGQKQVKISVSGPVRIVPSAGEPLFPDKLDETVIVPDEASLGLKLGDKAFFGAQELKFAPSPGSVMKIEGKPYKGEVIVKLEKGVSIKVIDYVGAEEYVGGVLAGEVPLAWPDAAVKAQAVAARTYAIWHWKHSQHRDHDVKADTRSQVFTGQATPRALQIAAATQGRVLTYDGTLFEAFFSAACAGETASAEWADFAKTAIPPLAGAKCGFCVACPHAAWERKFTQAELAKLLAPLGVKGRIERLETIPYPRAGYLKSVKVVAAGGETTIAADKLRFALKPPLKSTSFVVTTDPTGETLVVTGKGWGHGVGLCQWGAKGAADSGMDEDQILTRFYPGAAINKLY